MHLDLTVRVNYSLPDAQAFLAIQDHLLHHILGHIHLQGTPGQSNRNQIERYAWKTF